MLAMLLGLTLMTIPSPILTVPIETPKQIWMDKLHDCENPNNIPKIIDSNDRYSYGKYEWQMRSWLNYSKEGATKENIGDDAMQDKITLYVLQNGGWRNWLICSERISKTMEYPF